MNQTVSDYTAFAKSLGLRSAPEGLFVGKLEGFPVGLRLIDSPDRPLLFFEIRHWLKSDDALLSTICYEKKVSEQMERKTLDVEFDDHRAWLSISNSANLVRSGRAGWIVRSVLGSFKAAGLIGEPDLCHYCRRRRAEAVKIYEGTIVQICDVCLEIRTQAHKLADTTAEAVPILLTTPFAAVAGAFMWVLFWLSYDWFFELLGVDSVAIPGAIIIIVTAAALVGGPVGWMIRQNRKRGRRVSRAAALIFSVLAVVVGEIGYLMCLIHREFGVLSMSAALKVMPSFYSNNDFIFVGLRACVGLGAVVAAEVIAVPKEARLRL